MEKTCTRCGETKPLDEFHVDKRNKTDGHVSQCKECANDQKRDKRATDPVYAQRNRDGNAARRRGEKLEPLPRPTADERFDALLVPEPNTNCLIFIGSQFHNGYGSFRLCGKTTRAHRYAYWRHFGVIPKPEIHHKCSNKLCCEPSHLQAVTTEEHAAIHAAE